MPGMLQWAIGAVKDQTSIGLARVSRLSSAASTSNLEVAVLKATSHDEVPVEDRYATEVLLLSASSPSAAAATASALSRRISRTRSWVVALKSLSVASATILEAGPNFRREAAACRLLDLSSFCDDSARSSPWDFTAFVRTFALYLDARLQSSLQGHLPPSYRHRRSFTADMKPSDVLERIGHWQRLLDRAVGTRPTGPAKTNRLVQISLYSVVRESFDIYRDIVEGLSLLLNFFQLPYSSCVETYKACSKAAKQFKELDEFYNLCKRIGVGRASEYPSIRKISRNLLRTLDEFLKDHKDSAIPMSARLRSSPKSLLPPQSKSESEDLPAKSEGWEMVLAESTRKSITNSDEEWKTFKMESTSPISRIPQSYQNPSLNDGNENGLIVSPSMVPPPTFRALKASEEKMPEEMETTKKTERDPFGKSWAWVQILDASARQQLIEDQRLWLQHQSKIIEKNLAW